jgi:capsular polysaccharide export protein
MPHGTRYRTTSWALSRNRTLQFALDGRIGYRPLCLESGKGAIMAGWGRRPSGLRAEALAKRIGAPFLLLEDGFLRSVGRNDPSFSFLFDTDGIYYDATGPSALERLVRTPLIAGEAGRAANIISRWRELELSKYNSAPDYAGPLPDRYVLVVDQVARDASIPFGLANRQDFAGMLQAALDENPACSILVKVHPDTLQGAKVGNFDVEALKDSPQIKVIADNCHAVRLIRHADKVYTVTSQMGFEGLIWGKRVRCFGMPFYAGWGLTEDALPAPIRRENVLLEQLVFAALVRYPRYVDPANNYVRCEIETIMEYIAAQRRVPGIVQENLGT